MYTLCGYYMRFIARIYICEFDISDKLFCINYENTFLHAFRNELFLINIILYCYVYDIKKTV